MIGDGLAIDLVISAQIRTAARQGVPIVVTRRGDPTSGTVLLKINLLNGTAHVLTQTRYDDELVWIPATRNDPVPEPEADAYLEKQARIDPDIWILEIEDKQGRHWFDGRRVTLA